MSNPLIYSHANANANAHDDGDTDADLHSGRHGAVPPDAYSLAHGYCHADRDADADV